MKVYILPKGKGEWASERQVETLNPSYSAILKKGEAKRKAKK